MGVSTHSMYLLNKPNKCLQSTAKYHGQKNTFTVYSKLPSMMTSYFYLFSHQAFYSLHSGGPLLSLLPRKPRDSRLANTAGILPTKTSQEAKVVAQIRFHQAELKHWIFALYYVTSPGWRTRPQLTQSVL